MPWTGGCSTLCRWATSTSHKASWASDAAHDSNGPDRDIYEEYVVPRSKIKIRGRKEVACSKAFLKFKDLLVLDILSFSGIYGYRDIYE